MNKKIILFLSALMLVVSTEAQEKPKVTQVKKPKTIKTASGLEYTITQKGNGKKPMQGDKVVVHYTGKLTNDTVFDSSYKRNQPFTFVLGNGQVIKGWDEGVALLQVGDKATFRILPELGYGDADMGKIPPNSTLIFDVELINIIQPVKPIDAKGKDTITTASGLKYIMLTTNKEGQFPKKGDNVSVHYSGFFLDGKMFDSSVERGSPFSVQVGMGKVIKGWDEALVLLRKGEKAKLIIPYELAYGEKGRGAIPAKATLVFDVELLNITPRNLPAQYDTTGIKAETTATGLKYYVISKGKGPGKAGPGKQVAVHYTGYLEDGFVFDSSVERGQPFQVELGKGSLIKGWEEGISLMTMGDKYRFVIPYELGYGENGFPPMIPPKAKLIFDVELIMAADVQKPENAEPTHDHSDPNHKH